MDLFRDKIAIVTGGASGIGRGICELLGRQGANVTVADVNKAGADGVAAGIVKTGGDAKAVQLDVTDAGAVEKLIEETASEHGRLDYLFNNAGISVGGEVRDLKPEHWKRVIDVNLMGVINGTLPAYSLMVKQGFGHIVNTASLAGLIPGPMNTPYGTTKHAVVGLSTSLRAEGTDLGVKVSAVCPGFIQTGIWESSPAMNVDKEKALATIPLKMMDATKAAEKLLEGVERNRAIITLPFHARFMWWLNRIHPSLLKPFCTLSVKNFRKFRGTTD